MSRIEKDKYFIPEPAKDPLSELRAALAEGTGALMRPMTSPATLVHARPRIPIIAVGNLKGGVGKTTLAANLGAALGDQTQTPRPRPVLFLDLDFQGSLSSILAAAGRDILPEPDAARIGALAQLFETAHAPPVMLQMAGEIRRGELAGSKYFDAAFNVSGREERLLFDWVLGKSHGRDPRVALAQFLWSEQVQQTFSAVLLDLPPRPTLFQYAGLVAATHVVIPTRDDALSTEAASRFAGFLQRGVEAELWPEIKVLGVAGMNTDPHTARQAAVDARLAEAAAGLEPILGYKPPVLGKTPYMPTVAEVAARDLAYFRRQQATRILGRTPHAYFSEIRDNVLKALETQTPG